MIPDVPRQRIFDAMVEFDRDLRDSPEWEDWEDRLPHKYAIEVEGRRYPVKQIVSMATGAPVSSFSGGDAANSYIRQRDLDVVEIRRNPTDSPPARQIWWVNQGTSLNAERETGTIWAPLRDRSGHAQYHWETLVEVRPGDIILHHADGSLRYVSRVLTSAVETTRPGQQWQSEGREVRTEYHPLTPPVPTDRFASTIQELSIPQGPLTRSGGAKQGYLFRFTEEGLRAIQESQPETEWPAFAQALLPSPSGNSVDAGPPGLVQVRSWSRPPNQPDLIGRKRVDWSVFVNGSHVPIAFRAAFDRANGGKHVARGSSAAVELVIDGKPYAARLHNINRTNVETDAYHLRWDGNRDLIDLLKRELSTSYEYMVSQQAALPEGARMSISVPDQLAEFIDFRGTDTPCVYRVDLIRHRSELVCVSWQESVGNLIAAIQASGFTFEPWQIAAYVAALRTKPFVILAGVSGTGKSKLPKLVSAAAGGAAQLIAVRPDWTDSSEVLGYVDLQGRFRPGRLLEFAAEASAHPGLHYVAIIDEMNLARVEHYFAEVLSSIEDRRAAPDGGYESCPLLNVNLGPQDDDWRQQCLPPNLAIVGTVNMDESAHGFSRKVLDRAFTLEFCDIDLAAWSASLPSTTVQQWPVKLWHPRAIQLGGLGSLAPNESALVGQVVGVLTEVNRRLLQAQLQVGYRTRDEVALFVLHAQELLPHFVTKTGEPVDPLDLSLLMKVLPRIVGGSMAVRRVLLELATWATVGEQAQVSEEITALVQPWVDQGRPLSLQGARYPRTAARLCLMLDRLQSEGYTSFWL